MSGDDLTVLPAPQPSPQPGPKRFAVGDVVLRGQFRIDALVEGGMEADAYRGMRLADGAPVFVKYQWRRKGKHRALILERLALCDHPGCVKLLEYDVLERPIEVYEWVDGRPLSELLSAGSRRFTDAQVREVVRQLAEALDYLHRRVGTAHRDVKPSNVMVLEPDAPRLKLIDFGVMTLVDAGGATVFAGTKKYAPPEALRWSLPRDGDLMAYDWWSLGRVVQELVDGIHPYDRIAATLSEAELDAMDAVWSEVLSEHARAKYGRAGQVEHSAPAWRPLLRGLLTTDREARWRYDQVARWLAGEQVPDAYDASPYGTASSAQADADVIAEVRRLSSREGWEDACRIVVESEGIVARFRAMSENKRLQVRLRQADAVYDFLVRSDLTTTAEELLAMLVLRTIGGPSCPLALRGYELDVGLLVELARRDGASARPLIRALTTDPVLDAVETHAPELAQRLRGFARRTAETQEVLHRWLAGSGRTVALEQIVPYSAQSPDDNERLIDDARGVFAASKNAAVELTAQSETRTAAESAALAFAYGHAADFDFETVETVERRELELERARHAARAEERRRAEVAVAAARGRADARNIGRAAWAGGGAVGGALLDLILWNGAVSQSIAGFVTVVGLLVGGIAGAKEGCGGFVGGAIIGAILGALAGAALSHAVQAVITGMGGPTGGALFFAGAGAGIALLVNELRARRAS